MDSSGPQEASLTFENFVDVLIQRCTADEMKNPIDVLEPDGRTPAHSTSDLRRFRLDAETLLGKTGQRLDSSVFGTMSLGLVPGKAGIVSAVPRTVLRTDNSERRMEGELALSAAMLTQLSAEIRQEWGEPEMRLVAKSVSPHYKVRAKRVHFFNVATNQCAVL